MGLIRLCSSFPDAAAPQEVCARLRLLDTLGAVAGDLIYCVAAGVGFAAVGSSVVILAMRSLRGLLASSV